MLFNKIYDRINHLILCPQSEQMIRDVRNIELCELLEAELKTQCTVISKWNIGISYCTCGHLFQKQTAVNRKCVKDTMDLLSIPEYVIQKGRPHGLRYGERPGDKEYFTAKQVKKKCKKFFQGIHDRFLQDETFRDRMIENGREEDLLSPMGCSCR